MIPVILFRTNSEYGALPAEASAGRFSYRTKAVRFAAEKEWRLQEGLEQQAAGIVP